MDNGAPPPPPPAGGVRAPPTPGGDMGIPQGAPAPTGDMGAGQPPAPEGGQAPPPAEGGTGVPPAPGGDMGAPPPPMPDNGMPNEAPPAPGMDNGAPLPPPPEGEPGAPPPPPGDAGPDTSTEQIEPPPGDEDVPPPPDAAPDTSTEEINPPMDDEMGGEANNNEKPIQGSGNNAKPGLEYDSTRKYLLFKNYISLINALDNYTTVLEEKMPENINKTYIFKLAIDRLKKIRELAYDFTIMKFEISSYIQSLLYFQNLIVNIQMIFDMIGKSFKKIDVIDKSKNKKNSRIKE
jgi:hypothetical protein